MKWVQTAETGLSGKTEMTHGEGAGSMGEPISKTVGVLSGNQKAVYFYGMKLWVDDEGVIIRGPDLLIGYDYDKLKNIPYAVWFDIASSANRGLNIMNNEALSPSEREAVKQTENAKVRLAKAVDEWNKPRYSQIAPGTSAA